MGGATNMKNNTHSATIYILSAVLLFVCSSHALALEAGKAFIKKSGAAYQTQTAADPDMQNFSVSESTPVDVIKIAKSFTEPAELNLNYGSPVTSAIFSGKIVLENETSFARVILRDTSGRSYLIFDSFYMTSEENTYDLANICEETCNLNSITPASLFIDVSYATIYVDNVKVGQNKSGVMLASDQLKSNQSQHKIAVLTERVQNKGQDWVPGETSVTAMSYEGKKGLFGGKDVPELFGFDAYTDGVFGFPVPDNTATKTAAADGKASINAVTMPVTGFNWNCAHKWGNDCMNYLSPVRTQGGCLDCWTFATIGTLESLVNTSYNLHGFDFDFAEQDILSCSGGGSCTEGGNVFDASNYIRDQGTTYEFVFPYRAADISCSEKNMGSYYDNLVKIERYKAIPNNFEEICHAILNYGSLTAGIGLGQISNPSNGGTIESHVMTLVGYSDRGEDYLNELKFKNSWGPNWGVLGYCRIYYSTIQNLNGVLAYIGVLRGNDHFGYVDSTACLDNDGDGYYWWGIGARPVSCKNVGGYQGRDWNDQYINNKSYPLLYPVLEYPLSRDTVTNPAVNFKWDAAKNAQYYILNVRPGRSITLNASENNEKSYFTAKTTQTQYPVNLGNLAPTGSWIYFDVTAVNTNGSHYVSQRGEFKVQF